MAASRQGLLPAASTFVFQVHLPAHDARHCRTRSNGIVPFSEMRRSSPVKGFVTFTAAEEVANLAIPRKEDQIRHETLVAHEPLLLCQYRIEDAGDSP